MKRLLKIIFGIILIASLLSLVLPLADTAKAVPATYYVATDGLDSNPGTLAEPWLTPQKALNEMVAGDTTYIRAGEYNTNNLITVNSGSAIDGYITLQNYNSEEVTIHMYETNWNGFRIEDDYIKVIGLNFDGLDAGHLIYGNETDGYYSCRYGVYSQNADYVLIQNCHLSYTYWCTLYCTGCTNITYDNNELDHPRQITYGGEECMSICNTSDFEVKYCIVHDGGNPALGIDMKEGSHDGSVHHCEVYNLPGTYNGGIYIDGRGDSYNIDIYNNLVHDILGTGSVGISVGEELEQYSVYNVNIYNNIIYNVKFCGFYITQNGTADFADIYFVNNTLYNICQGTYYTCAHLGTVDIAFASNIVIRNNIFYSTYANTYYVYDPNDLYGNAKLFVDHNLWYNSGGVWQGGQKGTNTVELDPLFANPALADFHIPSGSPAKNAGSATLAPDTDYDGNARPSGGTDDIGAFEYLEGLPPSTISKFMGLGW